MYFSRPAPTHQRRSKRSPPATEVQPGWLRFVSHPTLARGCMRMLGLSDRPECRRATAQGQRGPLCVPRSRRIECPRLRRGPTHPCRHRSSSRDSPSHHKCLPIPRRPASRCETVPGSREGRECLYVRCHPGLHASAQGVLPEGGRRGINRFRPGDRVKNGFAFETEPKGACCD